MTPKQRVVKALNHEQTDIAPYNMLWEPGVRELYAERVGDPAFDNNVVQHYLWLDAKLQRHDLSEDEYVDEWGGHYKQGNIFHIVDPRLPEPQLGDYPFPDLSLEWRYDGWADAIARYPDKFVMAAFYGGFFERGCWLRGMENWLMDLVDHEGFVNEFLDGMMGVIMAFVDIAGIRDDVDAILVGDDYGQQRGLLMGPVLWRKYFKPRLAQVFSRIHEHGKYAAIHSCGDNAEIMGELIEIGLDIFHPFQPEAMDIVEMKRSHGARVTFNGGIGTQGALVHGGPDDVRREIRFALREIGRGGGFIIETAKALRHEVPAENIAALIEEFTNQHR
ncbi:MAG: uroporphyrinogen decarboxylase family protein [Armatimonadota bacterium]|nr:uroporphyrinogen decarboxylase family protein [Armatimonadota bacterium]